jgi:hypothetical protein
MSTLPDLLMMNTLTKEVRVITNDLNDCCRKSVWEMLLDMGYEPFGPAARAYNAQVSAAAARPWPPKREK